ncbi:phage holin family protein [Mechercharimyces sp. CAU 1602]|uniref:phage holin family protein n=1 Tax=Mechercharimyces sp. CAU 1602 TaxID=2973933 RepID=UPI002161D898|nr:phage holin family protein [Mechercharimyces sp. CAU 1602]MCS1350331.1 phage holin family protein [Mechercharimyces sp. CAU 1602]
MGIDWKSRLRNGWFWASVSSFVLYFLVGEGILSQVIADRYEIYFDMLMAILVGIGILIDPKTSGISDGGE